MLITCAILYGVYTGFVAASRYSAGGFWYFLGIFTMLAFWVLLSLLARQEMQRFAEMDFNHMEYDTHFTFLQFIRAGIALQILGVIVEGIILLSLH